MKIISTLGLLAFVGALAHADISPPTPVPTPAPKAPETYTLSTDFLLLQCTTTVDANGQSQADCQPQSTPPAPKNIAISLESCQDDGNGGTSCAGQSVQQLTIDGKTFVGAVFVTKTTDKAGATRFSVEGIVNNSVDSATSTLLLMPAHGALTDMAFLIGNTAVSSTDPKTSYAGALIVGPMVNAATPKSLQPLHWIKK